jgi:hypothetical protein
MPSWLMVDAEKAARLIVRGVARNRAIIVFPIFSRRFWWLSRIHPLLYAPFNRLAMIDFRKSIRKS